MPRFQLVSEFQPTGDQPEAIAALVEGIRRGHKHQTLLGATGTGKSLDGEEPLYILCKEDGGWKPRWLPIGELVDRWLKAHPEKVRQNADTWFIAFPPDDSPFRVPSLNDKTGQVEWKPVTALIRHSAPPTMFGVTTACGRHVRMTGDHNLWVLREGRMQLVPTTEIRPGDRVPVPRNLPEPPEEIATPDLRLLSVRWSPIHSVERVEYDKPFVYDISVADNETFLAGHGGMFVHNTYVMAKVIEAVQKPTLVISHNKTLAAQLYAEFRQFFPNNAVEYFVSYYDYYQPEAYLPQYDLYIEKDADINEEIDRLRLAAMSAVFSRRDVIIVASVSCIYAVGDPDEWGRVTLRLARGEHHRRETVLRHLVSIHYERNDLDLSRGRFRVRGDTLEVMPAHSETAYRIGFWGDEIERITEISPLTGEVLADLDEVHIFPAKVFITPEEKREKALADMEAELEERLRELRAMGKHLEAQRLEQRTRYDLEMIREVGYCAGIENYSRHLQQRPPGSPPWTLMDYFPADYLLIVDESHMTIPQIRGMYNGDRSRKETLVEYGFRLPSALDNRPLRFEEFEERVNQVIYTSATPGPYELEKSRQVVQQIIRPTGIVDPEIIVRPAKGQVDDLIGRIRERVARGERVLVTTLTKRMAEDLADYLRELGIKVHYLHSEVQTIERVEILRDLRMGVYDVVVGINLLREGLDLPEVSLVAILDADKEGFLRSDTALIQTIGRAARHVHGTAVLYADRMTDSMKRAIEETERRRAIQTQYNQEHGIVPTSIVKEIRDLTDRVRAQVSHEAGVPPSLMPRDDLEKMIRELEKQMRKAAEELEFEKAAMLRDRIFELRAVLTEKEERVPPWERDRRAGIAASRG